MAEWVTVSPRVALEARAARYERKPGDPLYRRLRVFALDPEVPSDQGGEVIVRIPWEPLEPGPRGAIFAISPVDAVTSVTYPLADLDAPAVLTEQGYPASLSDPRFHAQMCYAVAASVYERFRAALGRDVPLGLRQTGTGWHGGRGLRIRPFGIAEPQAYFDRDSAELRFGFFPALEPARGYSPRSIVYTCLSHDVLVHELTHAFLDAVRPNLMLPTDRDVLAFHEAFADLVAVFQRFGYAELVLAEIVATGGRIEKAEWLVGLAESFSRTAGIGGTLRRIDGDDTYDTAPDEPHARGTVLVQAVFGAFRSVLKERSGRIIAIATGGSGVLPPGRLSTPLAKALADATQRTASQFLSMMIRAIDYCPPFAITFGDFLRAVLTADAALVADDDLGYRRAWIESFSAHHIYPVDGDGVSEGLHLTQDALVWTPVPPLAPVTGLSFASTAFRGDPACPPPAHELETQARAIADHIGADEDFRRTIRLFGADETPHDGFAPAEVISIRSLRRVGPDGQLLFQAVAEVMRDAGPDPDTGAPRLAGATILFDAEGRPTHVIAKPIDDPLRMRREQAYISGPLGARHWRRAEPGAPWKPLGDASRRLCEL